MKKRTILTTRDVAFSAVLVALSIVTNTFAMDTGTHAITFTYCVCFIAGHFFGPAVGAIVGGVGDLVGCFVKGYAPNPLILIGSILVGLLPGIIQLISHKIKVKSDLYAPVWTVVSFVVVYVAVTMFWNTFALWFSYARASKSYWVYMIARLPLQTIVWAVNLGLSFILYPVISRVLHVKPTSIVQKVKERHAVEEEAEQNTRRSVGEVLFKDSVNPALSATLIFGCLLTAVLLGIVFCLQ